MFSSPPPPPPLSLSLVPTPPLNVSVLGFSSSAVLIKWLPPTHPNGIITGYTLYIDYPNNSISTVTISRELSLYFIEGLETNQNVAVSVSAATIIGNGLQSDTVSDETTGNDNNYYRYCNNCTVKPANETTSII